MAIIVNSPFSGQPVKIRDQDIDRAVRDEENRIFYVLPRSDGEGYYSSPTRAGGEKEEQRYLSRENKEVRSGSQARQQQATDLHDSTGKKRGGMMGKLVKLIIVLVVLGAAYYAWTKFGADIVPGGGDAG